MTLDKIYNEDCLVTMDRMIELNIRPDLVVTSPPYDDLRTYGDPDNGWSFDKFKEIADKLYELLPDGGVIVWVVNDKTIKGSKSGTSFRQAIYFKEIGFRLNDVMIWEKENPLPQIKQPRYCDSFEYIFCFSKGAPKTFNPIMVPCKYAGRVYNSTAKDMDGEGGRHALNYIVNSVKVHDNIFSYAVAQNKTGHPAVYPYQLASDQIVTWSNTYELVYDPFMGSGTTALASIRNGRRFIGSEISKEYCDIANGQIKKETYRLF